MEASYNQSINESLGEMGILTREKIDSLVEFMKKNKVWSDAKITVMMVFHAQFIEIPREIKDYALENGIEIREDKLWKHSC